MYVVVLQCPNQYINLSVSEVRGVELRTADDSKPSITVPGND